MKFAGGSPTIPLQIFNRASASVRVRCLAQSNRAFACLIAEDIKAHGPNTPIFEPLHAAFGMPDCSQPPEPHIERNGTTVRTRALQITTSSWKASSAGLLTFKLHCFFGAAIPSPVPVQSRVVSPACWAMISSVAHGLIFIQIMRSHRRRSHPPRLTATGRSWTFAYRAKNRSHCSKPRCWHCHYIFP